MDLDISAFNAVVEAEGCKIIEEMRKSAMLHQVQQQEMEFNLEEGVLQFLPFVDSQRLHYSTLQSKTHLRDWSKGSSTSNKGGKNGSLHGQQELVNSDRW